MNSHSIINKLISRLVFLLVSLIAVSVGGCKDDKEEAPAPASDYNGLKYTTPGSLGVKLEHKFNANDIVFNKSYVTEAGDTVTFDMLRYYFSNVQLKNTEGNWINLGNYNLVDFEDAASFSFNIANVPAGIYSKIRFYMGVDSVANSSGAQEGALNPANNMFWSWSSGYIFFKIQGKFGADKPIALHVGGNRNLPLVELDLSTYKKESTMASLNMTFDVADVFRSPVVYDLKTRAAIIHSPTSEDALVLTNNIANGVFAITGVE